MSPSEGPGLGRPGQEPLARVDHFSRFPGPKLGPSCPLPWFWVLPLLLLLEKTPTMVKDVAQKGPEGQEGACPCQWGLSEGKRYLGLSIVSGFWVIKESNASLGILKNGFTSMKVFFKLW